MARKSQVAVEPRPSGRWAVQTDGTSRADSLHDRQSDAIRRARELAKNNETELVIKGQDGRIRHSKSSWSTVKRLADGKVIVGDVKGRTLVNKFDVKVQNAPGEPTHLTRAEIRGIVSRMKIV
jgi:hypothetical protein